jgi:HK97 family phage major capsid protein
MLQRLRESRTKISADMKAIIDAVDPTKGLSGEAKARFDGLKADRENVEASIAEAEALADAERNAVAVSSVASAAASAAAAANPRASEKRFRSFGEQLQAVARAGMNKGQAQDPRLIWTPGGMDYRASPSGANEAIPSEGGFLVQQDYSTELLSLMHDMGEVMNRVRRIPISANSNGIKLPAIDETSRANGSRFGGVQSYWANEADTVTSSKPKFREMDLRLNKLLAIAYATDEILQDSDALEAVLRQAFAEESVFKVEDAIYNGDGSGKPLGILNSGALVTVTAESGQAAATIRTENVLKMWARTPIRSRKSLVWMCNQDIEPQLWTLTNPPQGSTAGSATILLYTPPGVNGNASPYGLLLGRPVIPIEYAATLGTVGDLVLWDPQQYVMIDKNGVATAASMHVRFLYEEMTFRFTFRVDGQPVWRKPVTPFKGSNTISPFVALATR